jgi:subtilisin family serine protease
VLPLIAFPALMATMRLTSAACCPPATCYRFLTRAGTVSRGAPVIRIEIVRRPHSALAACLLALCGLPLPAGPALAGPVLAGPVLAGSVLAGPGQLAPGPGEWWFGPWQVQRKVWPLSQGAGITVAEVESGVQASIPDLRGVVLPGADLTGAARSGDTDIQAGEDGHGTAMAVMIAGQGRGTGTVGIAPRARILPVTVGGSGPRSVATAAAGIRYAAAHGAQVIDMPFGIGVTSPARCDPALQAAVAYALGRDVVLIASSGNSNLFTGPDEPASCAGVLAVGGTEPDGTLWPASTREPYVAVAAPADHMVYVGRDGRFTTTGAGTSFAAALTAGAAALIRSRYPHMPWYEVDQRLTGTATPAGHPVPDDGYGYGIVNLARAVNASAYPVRASAPDPVLARYRAWLATPAGRTVAARYRLARPGPAASSASAAPSPGGGLRLRLPLGEIAATGAAAACVFVAVLLAVLWLSSRRARSRGSGEWEARTWSFGPDEDDPPGWPGSS